MNQETSQAAVVLRTQMERFVSFTDEEWHLLTPHLSLHSFRKHHFFAREGEVSTQVALVVQGMFRQFYLVDGEEKTTYFYFENHLMADYFSCISGQKSNLHIEALSDATLLMFPYPVLASLFDKSMAWQKFGRLMAEYLAKGLEERMVSLLTLRPEERYLELLTGHKKKITERIPQHYIANYLGITPVSLSRIRNRILKS